MSVTVKSLKKENDSLKGQIEALSKEFERLETKLKQREASTGNGQDASLHVETQNNLEFYSKSYDDLNNFKQEFTAELRQLKLHLDSLADKVGNIATAIEESQQYSYRYNVKVIGIPDDNPSESASETTAMCLRLFEKLGVEITRYDIDIAHRIPTRSTRPGPRPIICKLVRRVVREEIIKARKNITKVSASDIGLEDQNLLEEAQIFEHLTPGVQKLFAEAKRVQQQYGLKFCWVKNFKIYLRETEGTRPILIKNRSDLEYFYNRRDVTASSQS